MAQPKLSSRGWKSRTRRRETALRLAQSRLKKQRAEHQAAETAEAKKVFETRIKSTVFEISTLSARLGHNKPIVEPEELP